MQLEFFERYARQAGRNNIADVYAQSLSVIDDIISEQKIQFSIEQLRQDDKVFDGIATYLEYLKIRHLEK